MAGLLHIVFNVETRGGPCEWFVNAVRVSWFYLGLDGILVLFHG